MPALPVACVAVTQARSLGHRGPRFLMVSLLSARRKTHSRRGSFLGLASTTSVLNGRLRHPQPPSLCPLSAATPQPCPPRVCVPSPSRRHCPEACEGGGAQRSDSGLCHSECS